MGLASSPVQSLVPVLSQNYFFVPCPSWPLSCPKSCPMVCPKSCPKPCPKSCPNVLSPVLSNIGPPGLARNPDVWFQLVHRPRSWPAFHVPGPNFSELRNGTMSQQTQSDPTPSFFAVDPSDSAWSLRMGFHTLEQKFFSRPNFDPDGHGPSLASSPVPSLVPALSQVLAQPCPNVSFPCLVPMAWPGFHTSGPSWLKWTRRGTGNEI